MTQEKGEVDQKQRGESSEKVNTNLLHHHTIVSILGTAASEGASANDYDPEEGVGEAEEEHAEETELIKVFLYFAFLFHQFYETNDP